MVDIEFTDNQLLIVRFTGDVTIADIESAWQSLADPRFTRDHDVVVDGRTASVSFSLDKVRAVIARRDALPEGARGITCFITGSGFASAAVDMVKDLLRPIRQANWHLVQNFDEALAKIEARRAAHRAGSKSTHPGQ